MNDALIVTIYVAIDETMKTLGHQSHSLAALSDAEVLTVAVVAAQAFGNVTRATVGTIQRQLLVLENQGGTRFFGEPALSLQDFMRTDRDGRGVINILVADRLMQSPRLYATFLLWMLSELFQELPEVGDLPKPKLVFFFDEAHLLFTDAPKALMDKIEQVVRLIRSKGVGVYFATQNPRDIPDNVLGQLGNRFQHALRGYTPRDQKAVQAAAETFRTNPNLDTVKVLPETVCAERAPSIRTPLSTLRKVLFVTLRALEIATSMPPKSLTTDHDFAWLPSPKVTPLIWSGWNCSQLGML